MYNIIKKSLILTIIPLLFSCSQKSSITYLDKSYKTDTVTVDLQIPQVTGLHQKGFQQSLNDDIFNTCNEFLNKFKDAAKDLSIPSVFSAETDCFENNHILSMVTRIDYYTKKPHNNSFRITKNICKDNCKELSLKDLFNEDSYIDFLNNTLSGIVEKSPQEYSDLWAKPILSENQPFYITEDSLVIYYPPYELSYYTRGFVEFPIPLTQLSGYLSEEFRNMLL